MISSEVRLVLKCRVVSSLSFFRIYSQAFSTGIAVKSETTSNDTIDFKSAHVIDKGNFCVRKTLKSWHTAITSDADNNAKQLPRQYSILS